MGKGDVGREEWEDVVNKLKRDLDNADKTAQSIVVAKICQTHLLKFAEKELSKFPPAQTVSAPEKTPEGVM